VDFRQRTLKAEAECRGIGLHSGEKVRIKIKPAPPDTGIVFLRADVANRPMVRACFDNVLDTTLATTIGVDGCRISTVEHLMAAFFGLGVDNAVVEADGPEIPIMDGSAAPFVFLIKSTGIKQQTNPKRFIVIRKPFSVDDGKRSIAIYPSRELRIRYRIDFEHPLLRNQKYELAFSGGGFVRKISPARTFGFLKDVQKLKEHGFAKGGSLDNAVVVDDFRILNEDGLRFRDEFVRHKILDFVGDLSVLGAPVIGRFEVNKSGHFLNHLMLRELMGSTKHWKELAFRNPEEYTKNRVQVPAFGIPDFSPA
jgi:UDP-3-O-[3-hydroxymyristoyl] N-acetylglucosamine deacetylase